MYNSVLNCTVQRNYKGASQERRTGLEMEGFLPLQFVLEIGNNI